MNILRDHPFLTMVCSKQEKWPIYVEENLFPANMFTQLNMVRNNFFLDPLQDPAYFPGPNDFQGTGFDRGHLAAFMNHRRNINDANLTMNLMNVVPMYHPFNIGLWGASERYVQHLATTQLYNRIRVISGPIKQERHYRNHHYYSNPVQQFGNHRLIVPQHYFKVVIGIDDAAQTQDIDTFIFPHTANATVNNRPVEFYYDDLHVVEQFLGQDLEIPNLVVDLINGV